MLNGGTRKCQVPVWECLLSVLCYEKTCRGTSWSSGKGVPGTKVDAQAKAATTPGNQHRGFCKDSVVLFR